LIYSNCTSFNRRRMNRVLQTAMLREEAVGTAEKLIEQGKREGLREGLRRGVDRGRQEGKREGLQEGLQEGKREGLQEGLEKGRQEGVQEQREHTARELLARGLSAAEITYNLSVHCRNVVTAQAAAQLARAGARCALFRISFRLSCESRASRPCTALPVMTTVVMPNSPRSRLTAKPAIPV